MRVLLVDDEPDLADVAKHFLESRERMQVTLAGSAQEALVLLTRNDFDAIVSDYQMPEMNGIELLKIIRDGESRIPFILFTGKGREEVVIEALNSGADFYLQKGGDPRSQFAELGHKLRVAVARRSAEVEIREQHARLEALIDSSDRAVFSVDRNYCYTTFNSFHRAVMKALYGVDIELGKSILDYQTVPADREKAKANLDRALNGERHADSAFSGDDLLTRQEFVVSHIPIHGTDGSVVGVAVYADKVTENERMKKALEASRKRFETLFSAYNEGVALHEMVYDAEGRTVDYRILDVNPAFERMTGISKEKASGSLASHLYGTGEAPFLEVFAKAAGTGMPTTFDTYFLPLGRYFTISVSSPAQGTFATVFMDITERVKAVHALRESEDRYRHMLDGAGIGIGYWDLQGRLIMFNAMAARNLNGVPSDFAGRTMLELFGEEGGQLYLDRILKAVENDGPMEYEDKVSLPTGTRWFLSLHCRVLDASGKVVGVQIFSHDITRRKQAEEALRVSEEKYRLLLHESQDPIFSFYPDGSYRYANKAFAEMTGIPVEEILGRTVWDVFPQVEAERRIAVLKDAISTGTPRKMEVKLPSDDGDRYFLTSLTPIKDDMGVVISVICSSKDITERKRMEDALRESKGHLAGAQALGRFGSWTYDIESGKIAWTDEVFRIFGRELSSTAPDYSTLVDWYHPEDRQDFIDTVKNAVEGGIPYEKDWRILLPDNSMRYIHAQGENLSRDGRTTGLWGTIQDITERKKVEEAMQQSESRYRSVTENANEAIAVAQDGLLRFINPKAQSMIQLSEKEAVGQKFIDFIYPDDRAFVGERYQRRLMGEEVPARYDFRVAGIRGAITWVSLSVVRIIWDGRPATLNFLVDITERKHAEQELVQANRRLNLLGSITRHDALNQILVIQGNADLLASKDLNAEQSAHVNKIKRSADTIHRQMEFAKLYQEIGAHTPVWMSLHESVWAAKGSIHLGGMSIVMEGSDYLIRSDPMLEKVVYNLIDNCLRHSGGAKHLNIDAVVIDRSLVLIFEDDGQGISTEYRDHLFERGFGKNTGFGLFLSREILSITGMTIVENGRPGRGARFEIVVPAGDWRLKRSNDQEG